MDVKEKDTLAGVFTVQCQPEGSSRASAFTDHTEDEVVLKDSVPDEVPASPPDLQWLEDLEHDQGEDEYHADHDLPPHTSNRRIYADAARMFKLRRSLEQLDDVKRQKEQDIHRARLELKLCLQNIEDLLEQRENLEKEIEGQKAAENSVAVFRLRAQHKCLCQRLHSEEELEALIRNDLRQKELELCELEVELGRFSSVRQEMQEQEQTFHVLKAQKAATRLQQEQKVSHNLQRLRNKQKVNAMKDKAASQRKMEDDQMNRRKAAKFLKESIQRRRQQEAQKEQEDKELLEKRTQAVQSLKANIAVTQESLRIQQKRTRAEEQRKEQRQFSESLQEEGVDSFKHLYKLKQEEEIKGAQVEFKQKQKFRRLKIITKILQEEKLLKKRKAKKEKQEELWSKPKSTPTEQVLSSLQSKPLLRPLPPSDRAVACRQFSVSESDLWVTSDPDEDQDEVRSEGTGDQSPDDSLEEPEFSGLWERNYKHQPVWTQTDVEQEAVVTSSGQLHKKVSRKDWKGPPFISKPHILLFKDFEIGKTYKKKLILTNISYISNYCKLQTVSAQLKNYISISFDPPGCLSPGMSCDLQAIFQPTVNEDLEGQLEFSSSTGSFSVPLKCTIRKCDLQVDSQFVDVGSHMVGQTISRTITLTNSGALPTTYSLDVCQQTHPSQLSPQKTTTCQEEKKQSKTCDEQKNSAGYVGSEGVQTKKENEQEKGAKTLPEVDVTPDVDVHTDENLPNSTSEIHLGNMRQGEIGPFQNVKLEVIFTPTIPGETRLLFYITFSDRNTKPIPVEVRAVAVSVPVWVCEPNINLKICMFDRLYQHTVVLRSQANTALKVTFDLCQEMNNHIQILPKTGFVQAKSSFNAQLKFMPRCSLPKDAKQFFDPNTGVLEVPLTLTVAGQVQPIHFTVQAIVTSTDLTFDPSQVDFGSCSVYHSVRRRIHITNCSLLPQDFGFTGVPQFLDVQPNDGFGTLLPQETTTIDLIFSPKKEKNYNFQLLCKSGINRDFLLSCRALGVRPPLGLSCSLVSFRATAVGDCSTALLHLSHHPLPDKAPPKPRFFCFDLPKVSELSISPSAGPLLPGQCCSVQVCFRPRLSEHKLIPVQFSEEHNTHTGTEPPQHITDQQPEPHPDPDPNSTDIQPQSEQYQGGLASVLSSFSARYQEWTVPCWVSDPLEEQASWSMSNTLYLKLQCPSVQPPLVVISDSGQSLLDFHQVATGERVIKKCTVQNISKETLNLSSSVLDVHGPFTLINALRRIPPGGKHTLIVTFNPERTGKYLQYLEIQSRQMKLQISLCGEGVDPDVSCSYPGPVLDFGWVLNQDSTCQVLKLQNRSTVDVGFRIQLPRLDQSGPWSGTDGLDLLQTTDIQATVGFSVFRAEPAEGSVSPGQTEDITVTFSPVHPCGLYTDTLRIQLKNGRTVCELELRGGASSHNTYVYGGDPPTLPLKSLAPPLPIIAPPTGGSDVHSSIPVMLTLKARFHAGGVQPAVRQLQVGCIRCTQASKKSTDFQWDQLTSLQQKGFSVEPIKGSIEAGLPRTINVIWRPQEEHKPYDVVQACASLILKSDHVSVYRIILSALVSDL